MSRVYWLTNTHGTQMHTDNLYCVHRCLIFQQDFYHIFNPHWAYITMTKNDFVEICPAEFIGLVSNE